MKSSFPLLKILKSLSKIHKNNASTLSKIICYKFDSQYHGSLKNVKFSNSFFKVSSERSCSNDAHQEHNNRSHERRSLQYQDKDLTYLWKLLTLNDDGNNNAKLYLEQCQQKFNTSKQQHVAIYCRRNDLVQLIKNKIDYKI